MYINVPRNIAMTPERNWMPLKFAMYSNSCHSSVRSSINSCDCKKKESVLYGQTVLGFGEIQTYPHGVQKRLNAPAAVKFRGQNQPPPGRPELSPERLVVRQLVVQVPGAEVKNLTIVKINVSLVWAIAEAECGDWERPLPACAGVSR